MKDRHLVGNPLLEAWTTLAKDASIIPGWTHFKSTWAQVYRAAEILEANEAELAEIKELHQHAIDRPYPSELGDGSTIAMFLLRRVARKFAWAVPGEEALAALAALSPIVEIGAGTGYWAALLAERGADVVAYDMTLPGEKNGWHPEDALYFPVEVGGPEMAAKHPDRTLFLCWPPYSDDMAHQALRRYGKGGGQQLAFIGEGSGGCTADEGFFVELGEGCQHWGDDEVCDCAPADWEETDSVAIPQWEGIHDRLTIYRRKAGA